MTVGQRIAQKRKELGLSQETLGEQLGVSRQAIYKWESDATLPEIEKLIALSRIFSVSVGWLLGVEDTPTGAEQADSGDLSETQLRMVKEIVDGYLAAQPKPEPPKRRRWPKILGTVACVALIAVLADLFSRMNEMTKQYTSLSNSIGNVQYSVSSQLGSLTGRMEEILQSQNSLLADQNTQLLSIDPSGSMVSFSFRATPKTYQEGLVAWIDVENDGERSSFGPYAAEKESFSGEFSVALTDHTAIYIVFELDGVRQTQLLDTYSDLYTSSLPSLYLDTYPLTFSIDSRTGQLHDVLDAGIEVLESNGFESTPEEAGLLSCRIGLFADQELVVWFTPGTRTVTSDGVQTQEERFFLSSDGIELDREKSYCIAAVVTDRYGRTVVYTDSPVYWNGSRWTYPHSYSSGPFLSGWSY